MTKEVESLAQNITLFILPCMPELHHCESICFLVHRLNCSDADFGSSSSSSGNRMYAVITLAVSRYCVIMPLWKLCDVFPPSGVYSEPVFPFWKQRSVHNRENISPPPSPPKSHPSRTGNDISGTGPTNNHHSCLGDAVHNVKSTTVSRNRASSAICGRDIQSKGTNELGLEHRKAMALERHKRRNLKMQMRGLAADNTVTSTSPSANPKTFSQCQKTVLPSGKPKGCTTTVGHPFCFADPDPSFAARKLHYAKFSPEDRGHLYTVCLSLVSTRCKADLIEKMRAFTLLRTRASITATRAVESLAPSQELGYLRLTYMLERVIRKWQEQRLKVALKAMSRNVVSGSQHKYFVLKRLLRMLLEQLERRKQRAFLGWRMTCLQDTARDAKDEASIMREGYVEKVNSLFCVFISNCFWLTNPECNAGKGSPSSIFTFSSIYPGYMSDSRAFTEV